MKNLGFVCLVLLFSLIANAEGEKNLTNRLGVGFSNQMGVGNSSTGLPSIMAKYYPDKNLAFSAALGISTGASDSSFGVLVKIYRVIFAEESMLFYMGGGAGLVSNKVSNTNSSGFEMMGVVGGEFFFKGLDSLGLMFEAGIGVISLSSDVSFRTIGHSPLNAGFIFYF